MNQPEYSITQPLTDLFEAIFNVRIPNGNPATDIGCLVCLPHRGGIIFIVVLFDDPTAAAVSLGAARVALQARVGQRHRQHSNRPMGEANQDRGLGTRRISGGHAKVARCQSLIPSFPWIAPGLDCARMEGPRAQSKERKG